jgi:pyruvate-formate lyase-activating enzyme
MKFHLILLKPTHYDADSYPIQWQHNWIASNSLACINALALDCRERKVLGPDVEIVVHAMDEISRRIPVKDLLRLVQRNGNRALVCLVGVQSNQFPRAMDIARPFLAAGLPIIAGGIHVSGCVAMLKELPADLREAQALGISLFAGEAEDGRFELVVREAYADKLQPLYNFLERPPEIQGQPVPVLPRETLARSGWLTMSIFDMGRGCPFQCSFCTIINVHGHKSRFRTADDLERIIMHNHAMGVHQFFVTDDNLARNRNWEALFDRLIELREHRGIKVRMQIQVDTQAYRIPGFIDKATRAGVDQVFMGLESVNPENLAGAGKHQNRIGEFREMMLAWKQHPVVIICAYIIGFPNDTPESVRRDVEFLKRELPIDLVYFTMMQPLPGSKDHQRLWEQGVWMDPDMNKYDTTQPVMEHPKMTMEELRETYLDAWRRFYTFEHMETVLRRMFALGSNKKLTTANRLHWFSYFYPYMGIHPIDGGHHPIRKRRDRRPTLPLENPLLFYPKNLGRVALHYVTRNVHIFRVRRLLRLIQREPAKASYCDAAIAPALEKPGCGQEEELR